MTDFIIETAGYNDIDFFLSLSQKEGWNPGINDRLPFYKTDPHGFFIGRLDGKRVGCISAVAYDATFGFMGFYIILPEYRGKGFGLKLWNHAIEYLGNRCIGLDGVIAQQDNYRKSLFKFYYRNIRFVCQAAVHKPSQGLMNIHSVPFKELLEYDHAVFGLDRTRFLQEWIHMPNAFSFAKIEQQKITGYGVIRRCSLGNKIGPLFADKPECFKEIYATLCTKVSGPIFLDVPEINTLALEWAASEKLEKVFETARMYNQKPPKSCLEKVYGVTSFELG